MKYLYKESEAIKNSQYGIDLTVYPTEIPGANVVRISTEKGHFEEFYNEISTFIYTIIKGEGTFVLNDEKFEVVTGDQVVIPPMTRIYYAGKFEMVLTVTPAFNPENEVHVRDIDDGEFY